jgi:hypothetical protein
MCFPFHSALKSLGREELEGLCRDRTRALEQLNISYQLLQGEMQETEAANEDLQALLDAKVGPQQELDRGEGGLGGLEFLFAAIAPKHGCSPHTMTMSRQM